MPEFQRLPDRSLILRGASKPAPTRTENFRAALAGFLNAFRAPPKQDQWWIEKPAPVAARPAPAPVAPLPASLPAYNDWSDALKETAERERIVRELGDFPKRMMESPLVEGRLF